MGIFLDVFLKNCPEPDATTYFQQRRLQRSCRQHIEKSHPHASISMCFFLIFNPKFPRPILRGIYTPSPRKETYCTPPSRTYIFSHTSNTDSSYRCELAFSLIPTSPLKKHSSFSSYHLDIFIRILMKLIIIHASP